MTDRSVSSGPQGTLPGEETKSFLLRKALTLFLGKSYGSVSLDELIRETGLSKGAVYHHFRGKDDIFRCVVDRFLLAGCASLQGAECIGGSTPFLRTIRYSLSQRASYIETLRNLTEHKYADFAFYRLIMQAEEFYPEFGARVKALVDAERDTWKLAIHRGVQVGELDSSIDVELFVNLLLVIPPGVGLTSIFTKTLSMETFRDLYKRLYRAMKSKKSIS